MAVCDNLKFMCLFTLTFKIYLVKKSGTGFEPFLSPLFLICSDGGRCDQNFTHHLHHNQVPFGSFRVELLYNLIRLVIQSVEHVSPQGFNGPRSSQIGRMVTGPHNTLARTLFN
jgi:hypothetical protein